MTDNEQLRAAQKQLKESSARILALEEAVLVLAECVNFAVGPMCRVGLVGVVDYVDRELESNPTARAAVEKARSTRLSAFDCTGLAISERVLAKPSGFDSHPEH